MVRVKGENEIGLRSAYSKGSEGSRGKVLKMDRPAAGGFLSLTGLWPEGCGGGFAAILKKGGAASAAGCVEGLHRFAQGATAPTALRVVDCRRAAMLIKSALRDWLYESYILIRITVISHLRWLSPPFGALRHHLPPAVSVGRQKESAFMGRLGALLRPTCTSYAGCAQWTIKHREAISPYATLS